MLTVYEATTVQYRTSKTVIQQLYENKSQSPADVSTDMLMPT